jgi:hypothetical protein
MHAGHTSGRWARPFLVALACFAWGCADPVGEAYTDHETDEDFIVEKSALTGLPATFDKQRIMDDAFFVASESVGEAEVQRFLERTPYGSRCFLADEHIDGRTAAAEIVAGARSEGINPVVLLARMQVEKSLISKTSRPSARSVDYAFGCGCPDGRACDPAYRGLRRQVACAARTLRRHFDGSIAGTSPWVMGRSKRTLDRVRVTPSNHATASLYSYTPWVLSGRGGNWLVWNVTTKFARGFAQLGPLSPPAPEAPAGEDDDAPESPAPEQPAPEQPAPEQPAPEQPAPEQPAPEQPALPPAPAPSPPLRLVAQWIGDACTDDSSCAFLDGTRGVCQTIHGLSTGVCTVSCEGLCPDLAGHGSTFCVPSAEFSAESGGLCARRPGPENLYCLGTPGLWARTANRYIGRSNAVRRQAEVCLPVR